MLNCLVLVVLVGAPAAAAQELRALGQRQSFGSVTTAESRKIVSSLRGLSEDVTAFRAMRGHRAAAAAHFSSALLQVDDSGRVHVYVSVHDTTEASLTALRIAGLTIEIVNEDFRIVQGWIDVSDLDTLASEPAVTKIRPPSYGRIQQTPRAPRAGAVDTQGDAIHRCDQVRAMGLTGAGVKVGVVSGGLAGLAAAQAAGELPSVHVLWPGPATNAEGTATLEIIHDCAPGATLAYASTFAPGATTITSLSFIQAINALRDVGSDVIVDDVLLMSEPFFQDGPSAMNDRSVGNTLLRVSAAGNSGQAHYQGTFTPAGANVAGARHDFGGGDSLLGFSIPTGTTALILLQWANPFGFAADDYDLCVRAKSGVLIACSLSVQNGNDDPIEGVLVSCAGPIGALCAADIQVTRFAGSARVFDLFCLPDFCHFDHLNMRTASIKGHQAVPEVLAVAAAPATNPDIIEPFSSAGPATISFPAAEVRFKPELTAVNRVTTSRPEFNPFAGTSASAPHVAAIAALVIEANRAYRMVSPRALGDALMATAVDLGPPGPDTDSGFGRADALNAVNAELAKARCELQSDRSSVRVGETFTVTLHTLPGMGDPWMVFAIAMIFSPGEFTFHSVDLASGAFGPPNIMQPSTAAGPISTTSRPFTFVAPFVGQVGGFCFLASPDLLRVSPSSFVPISFTP